jgi:hypothetical protein
MNVLVNYELPAVTDFAEYVAHGSITENNRSKD